MKAHADERVVQMKMKFVGSRGREMKTIEE